MFKIDPKKKKRFLQDIEIEEISLVTKGANRHTFAIVKAAEKSLDEALKEFMGLVKDEEADIVDKAGAGDTKKAMEAVKEAIKTLTPYMDVLADDARQAVKLLAGVAGGAAASYGQGGDYGYPAKDEGKADEVEDKKWSENDRLKFYKEDGMSQLDMEVHKLFVRAKEDRRRSDPRHDDGFIFKAADDDEQGDDEDHDHVEKAVSQSLKGQEDNEDAENEPTDNFPSLQLPVFPRDRGFRRAHSL